MPKWVKLIIAVLLLPACAGAAMALWQVVRATGKADTVWVAMLSGAGCWLAVFFMLPKPMWMYVFGHELTHALWTWAMGGRVKKFKTSSEGGHVVVTKTNFLIVLAPYFFPLYAVLVVLLFTGGDLLWGWSRFAVWFHLLLGLAYAFHLTLTVHVLGSHQSDITSQGWLFSGVVIFLGNILVLLIGIPLVMPGVSTIKALGWWLQATGRVVVGISNLF
jgi:hypothetical protein